MEKEDKLLFMFQPVFLYILACFVSALKPPQVYNVEVFKFKVFSFPLPFHFLVFVKSAGVLPSQLLSIEILHQICFSSFESLYSSCTCLSPSGISFHNIFVPKHHHI